MKYIVWFNDGSMGYGCYVHLIGIFDTMQLAQDAIKKVEEHIKPYILKDANAKFYKIDLMSVEVNDINYPGFEENWMYASKYLLGGFME